MGGSSLLTFAQNVAQFIVGPFGVSMGTFAIAIAGLMWAFEMGGMGLWGVGKAVFGIAILFSAAWMINTFIGA